MEDQKSKLEVWMRGPVSGIPDLLQPIAHVFLQIQEDINTLFTYDLETHMWVKPFGVASIAFHIQHISGVIDRMLTYASNQSLTEDQFTFLAEEGKQKDDIDYLEILHCFNRQIERALSTLSQIKEDTLKEERFLGRQKIPTTQLGLLFHAAEHANRHFGQLIVTIKVVKAMFGNPSMH